LLYEALIGFFGIIAGLFPDILYVLSMG